MKNSMVVIATCLVAAVGLLTWQHMGRLRTETAVAQADLEAVTSELQKAERDLDRLQRALGRIADTRRTALGLLMTLDDSNRLEFDFDKAELRPENREILSRIAGVLLAFQDYQLDIVGHADDVGTEGYNQALSERRALAVRDYLVEAGLNPESLSVVGLGESSPLVSGMDPESRQRNRRVELAVEVPPEEDSVVPPHE